jgi:hypothetical protein
MSTIVAPPTELMSEPRIKSRAEVTPEEFQAMSEGGHFELLDGELVERNVSAFSSVVASRINRHLGNHCDEHHLGWVLESEVGYRCFA